MSSAGQTTAWNHRMSLARKVDRGPEGAAVVGVDRRQVVEERVDPHVDPVRVVARDADAELRRRVVGDRARHRHGLEPVAQTPEHLVAARLGLDEPLVRLDVLEEALLVLGEVEEVVLLGALDQGLAGHGRDEARVLGDRLGEVLLLRGVVPARVVAQVDVARLDQCSDVPADAGGVPLLRRADEIVVGRAHEREGELELLGVLVGPLDGGELVGQGVGDDLVGVLVGAGQEEDRAGPPQAGQAGKGVRDGGGVAVADVRPVVDVVDRRGDVRVLIHGLGVVGECRNRQPPPPGEEGRGRRCGNRSESDRVSRFAERRMMEARLTGGPMKGSRGLDSPRLSGDRSARHDA
jgi:hypothetical protein